MSVFSLIINCIMSKCPISSGRKPFNRLLINAVSGLLLTWSWETAWTKTCVRHGTVNMEFFFRGLEFFRYVPTWGISEKPSRTLTLTAPVYTSFESMMGPKSINRTDRQTEFNKDLQTTTQSTTAAYSKHRLSRCCHFLLSKPQLTLKKACLFICLIRLNTAFCDETLNSDTSGKLHIQHSSAYYVTMSDFFLNVFISCCFRGLSEFAYFSLGLLASSIWFKDLERQVTH